MNCPNCGSQNSDSSKFCIHCGHALPEISDTVRTEEESVKISDAERKSSEPADIADRAERTLCECEAPAASVSVPESDVYGESGEKVSPAESGDSPELCGESPEDVCSGAEAENCESLSAGCPCAGGEATVFADAAGVEEASAAQNTAEAVPNAESAAPYGDAPAASYTAPSGNFPYNSSVSVGAVAATASGNASAAFAPPAYTAHAPNPYMKAESLRGAKLNALKKAVISPSYIIAAVSSLLIFLLTVCIPFISSVPNISSALSEIQKSFGTDIAVNVKATVITASVIAAIPLFLAALGMWLGFFACLTKKDRVSTAGFTLWQVLLCIALVFVCIFFLLLVLSFVFIIIGIVSGAGIDIFSELPREFRNLDTSVLSFAVYAVIFVSVALMTLVTVWLARLIVTVSSVKAIARAYDTKTRISGFAAGMCIVYAVALILSAVGYTLVGFFTAAISDALCAVFLIAVGVFVFSLKRKVNAAVDEVENYFDGASYAYAGVPNGYNAAYGAAQVNASYAAPAKAPTEAEKTAEMSVPASPAAAEPVRNPAPARMQNVTAPAREDEKVPHTAEASPDTKPTEEKRASSPYIQIERNR